MIPSLLRARFRLSRLRWPALFALLLGAAAVVVCLSPLQKPLNSARGELPEVFIALGFFSDISLQAFLASHLFGFVMPLLLSVFGVHMASVLVSGPLEDGRMALLLAAPYRKGAILFTLGIVSILSGILLCLAALTGQMLAALILAQNSDIIALLRLNAGFMMVGTVCAALPLPIALLTGTDSRMRRLAGLMVFLQLVLMMASRFQGFVRSLRYLTFWSLFEPAALTFGSGGFRLAGLALALALLLVLLSMLLFERREV